MSDVLVLCYHAVSSGWDHPMAMTPLQLRAQVMSLQERGYRFETFTRAVLAPPGGRVAVVTFDDGFRGVRTTALPLLQELGVPATLFVPTTYIGTAGPMSWPGFRDLDAQRVSDALAPLSWEEVLTLAAAGWEIGSHTRSHPWLTRQGDAALEDELAGSRAACERQLGVSCTSIAYPFGDVDERVAMAAQSAGYAAGATLHRAALRPGPMWTPRVCVNRADDPRRFAVKVARPMRTSAAAAAVGAAHRVRRGRRRHEVAEVSS